MLTKQNIESFFAEKNIAVAGASAKKENFGNAVITEMLKKAINVFPIHPSAENIMGLKCYKSVIELPDNVKSIYIVTKPENTNGIVIAAKQRGINNIWIQQMSGDSATEGQANECNLINGHCIFMYLEPVKGIHKFHRTIKKLFGKLPK